MESIFKIIDNLIDTEANELTNKWSKINFGSFYSFHRFNLNYIYEKFDKYCEKTREANCSPIYKQHNNEKPYNYGLKVPFSQESYGDGSLFLKQVYLIFHF